MKMHDPAVVMSIKEGKAVVLAQGGRFYKVRDRNFHVGQRIILEPDLFFLPERMTFAAENMKEKLIQIRNRLRYKGMIIAGALILVPSSAYAASKYIPWTCVSLDSGNISIQYRLNMRGEVLSTETLSEEGDAVIDSLEPVRFEKFEDAMNRTLSVIYKDDPQITEERDPLVIGISTRFGSGEETANAISDMFEHNEPAPVHFEHLNWSEIRNADSEDLSIGRYSLKQNPDENLENESKPVIETMQPRLPDNNSGAETEKKTPENPESSTEQNGNGAEQLPPQNPDHAKEPGNGSDEQLLPGNQQEIPDIQVNEVKHNEKINEEGVKIEPTGETFVPGQESPQLTPALSTSVPDTDIQSPQKPSEQDNREDQKVPQFPTENSQNQNNNSDKYEVPAAHTEGEHHSESGRNDNQPDGDRPTR